MEKYTYEQLQEENERLLQELKRKKLKLNDTLIQMEEQNKVLEESHRHLADSINYAQRIQNAIMPPDSYIREHLPFSFILYMPKDVISGDFYYVEQHGDNVLFSAVDCTGHGVPGALMSVVGFNCIDQAVNEKKMSKPSDILKFLDVGVNKILRQTGDESGVHDGMDLGFCNINLKTRDFQFAGAFNPVYIIADNQDNLPKIDTFRWEQEEDEEKILEWPPKTPIPFGDDMPGLQIKADKYPIGVNTDGIADNYTNHSVTLNKGNCVYLLSDGYPDQFGGPKNKKYGYKKLRNFLCSIHNQSMGDQRLSLESEILNWQGDLEQIDDILIIGVQV